MQVTTRDVGLAIRDFIEGETFYHFGDDKPEPGRDRFEVVDCSDPDNLHIVTMAGVHFTVRIIAGVR